MGKVAAGWQSQDGRVDRMHEAAMLDRRRREEIEIKLAERRGELLSLESIVTMIKFFWSWPSVQNISPCPAE